MMITATVVGVEFRLCRELCARLSSGRFASLEISSTDRHVAAVTARVQATAQDCAVCPLSATTVNAAHCFASRSRLL